jgi:hypothetical protein
MAQHHNRFSDRTGMDTEVHDTVTGANTFFSAHLCGFFSARQCGGAVKGVAPVSFAALTSLAGEMRTTHTRASELGQ